MDPTQVQGQSRRLVIPPLGQPDDGSENCRSSNSEAECKSKPRSEVREDSQLDLINFFLEEMRERDTDGEEVIPYWLLALWLGSRLIRVKLEDLFIDLSVLIMSREKMRCNEDVDEDNPNGVKVLQDGQSARRCDKSLLSPSSWLIYKLLLLPRLPMSVSTMAREQWRPSCLREIVEGIDRSSRC